VYLVNGYGVFVGATCIVSSDMMDSSTEEPNPEATLTSISANYYGGNVVVGTDVSDLTGIVVTAHYSDDSTTTVTKYTLSGTIVEGINTITVIYGGKTATFAVVGEYRTLVVNPVDQWRRSGQNRVLTHFNLNIGDIVDFSDSSLWETYKIAIGPGEYVGDIAWYDGGYQTGPYTLVVNGLHCVFVARKDNADIDADEMSYIADNVGYIPKD
jgi:hypothetical protein